MWMVADVSGFVKEAAVQPASCLNMLHIMYLWIPMVLSLIITFIMSRMNVEDANENLKNSWRNVDMEYKGMNGLILPVSITTAFASDQASIQSTALKTHLIRMRKVILCVKQQRRVRNMV